jgi:cyclic pyranopterin phosphate synthase
VTPRKRATLTHVSAKGTAHMVDVGTKPRTARRAIAGGAIRMSPAAFAAVRDDGIKKGDVLGVARIAGIQAAKRTPELIPLCHPLAITSVEVECALDPELPGVQVRATVQTVGQTGVEMEAMTAASVALLTIYDMAKSADKAMVIEQVRLLEKSGGKSGVFRAR